MQSDISIDHARTLIDHGAAQGPNWWLAAIAMIAFGVLVAAGIRGAKWIIGRHEALTAALDASNREQVTILKGVVEKNTEAWIANKIDVGTKLQTIDNSIRELTNAHRMSLRQKGENHG